jgi:protein-S-isoprenylcysteine O-methyltransferase Ste14
MRKPIERKVSAAAFAGALVTVALGLVSAFGVVWEPDPAWVAALTTLVAVFAGWLVPSAFVQAPAPADEDYSADT